LKNSFAISLQFTGFGQAATNIIDETDIHTIINGLSRYPAGDIAYNQPPENEELQ
jgi:hypothetical protein